MKLLLISFALLTLLSCSNSSQKVDNNNMPNTRVECLPFYTEPTFTPRWYKNINLDTIHSIPDFTLINQNGDTITNETFHNKIYVANFFFTSCPGICPKMTTNLHLVQEAFLNNDSVLILSHSVTPERDSIKVLQEYAKKNNIISGKWHLVTGNRDLIYYLGRKVYFAEEDLGYAKSNDEFLHTENLLLIDENKHIRGIYNGLNKTSVNQLIEDIKLLLKKSEC
jgi:protein SCO1/2